MENKLQTLKKIFTAVGAWISNKLGLFFPALTILTLLMIIDYISGMCAAKKEALEHPDDPSYGWSSKKSILGIYKKTGYIFTILVAICTDYLIYYFSNEIGLTLKTNTIFALLVTIWFIINELISIIENAGRMGANLPAFLSNILTEMRNNINKKS